METLLRVAKLQNRKSTPMLAFVRIVERVDNVKKKSEMLVKFQNQKCFLSNCLISSKLLNNETNSFNQGRIFLSA